MRLTPHFTLAELVKSETATKHGIDNTPSGVMLKRLNETAWRMEIVRTLLGNVAILVSSGFRNERVNKLVGGVPNSDHQLAYAIDFKARGLSVAQTCTILRQSALEYDQLIDEYGRWVHISFNPRMRRQFIRARK